MQQEVKIRKFMVKDSPDKKVCKNPSQPIVVYWVSVIPAAIGMTKRSNTVQASSGIKQVLVSKITNIKRGTQHGSSGRVPV
jgi:hypothetical protein